jgi:hypothetical protein
LNHDAAYAPETTAPDKVSDPSKIATLKLLHRKLIIVAD